MKKILCAAAALAISASSFAEAAFHFADSEKKSGEFFSNELSSDIFHYFDPEYGDSHTNFAGLSNEVIAEYVGKKLSLGIDATFSFKKSNPWDDDSVYNIDWSDIDYYVEYNAANSVSVGFHDVMWTAGSWLPVADVHALGGDYGTDGIAAVIRPTGEFTFVAGIDFGNVHGGADWFGDGDRNQDYAVAIGADYSSKQFSVGGSIHHLITDKENLLLGAYASINADSLTVNVGFTHSEQGDVGLGNLDYLDSDYYYEKYDGNLLASANVDSNNWHVAGIYGENVLTAGLMFGASKFNFGADLAYSFDDDDHYYYDFYGAVDFNIPVDKRLGFDVKGFVLVDFGDDIMGTEGLRNLDPTIGVYPKITFAMNKNHAFAAGLIAQFGTDSDYGYTAFALPVSWKYTY